MPTNQEVANALPPQPVAKPYEKPRLSLLGGLAELTAAGSSGNMESGGNTNNMSFLRP